MSTVQCVVLRVCSFSQLRLIQISSVLLLNIGNSACYLSQSLPPTLDMLSKYTTQQSSSQAEAGNTCWKAMLANANVGGENVHRGAVLGAILGARAGDESLPRELKDGLYDKDEIGREIDAFVESVLQKSGMKDEL